MASRLVLNPPTPPLVKGGGRRGGKKQAGSLRSRPGGSGGVVLVAEGAVRRHWAAAGSAAQAAVRHRPVHGRADEHRSVLNALGPATGAAAAHAGVDLVAVVLVVGDP